MIDLVTGTLPGGIVLQGGTVDPGDTAWLLVATALVMLMTPGVALFYGGLVRRKNMVSTLMLGFVTLLLISVQWILYGYSLAFGGDIAGVVGDLRYVGLTGVFMEPSGFAPTVPHLVFMMFQGMFAIITAALIVGGIVERIKISAWMVFVLLWATFVYDPIAHWVWGDGWLAQLGILDFAGGIVVHSSAGLGTLALVFVLGARRDFGESTLKPHNVPFTLLGAALLWFGWFGFNAGSALAADGLAGLAFVTTNTSAAVAGLTFLFLSWWHETPSAVGVAIGLVAGLVAITPAAGYVTPLAAIPIGVGAGVFVYYPLKFLKRAGIDDSLDVWAAHGMGGTWGIIATGIFATVGATGLLAGNPDQLVVQIIGEGATWIYAFVVTFVIAKAVDMTIGLRVEEEMEERGLDLSLHGEEAYALERPGD